MEEDEGNKYKLKTHKNLENHKCMFQSNKSLFLGSLLCVVLSVMSVMWLNLLHPSSTCFDSSSARSQLYLTFLTIGQRTISELSVKDPEILIYVKAFVVIYKTWHVLTVEACEVKTFFC